MVNMILLSTSGLTPPLTLVTKVLHDGYLLSRGEGGVEEYPLTKGLPASCGFDFVNDSISTRPVRLIEVFFDDETFPDKVHGHYLYIPLCLYPPIPFFLLIPLFLLISLFRPFWLVRGSHFFLLKLSSKPS